MIDFILLFFLVVSAIATVRMKDLLSAIIMLGAYSLIMSVVWTRLNAVDVAFTEASVGAGITTILLIAALSRTQKGKQFSKNADPVREEEVGNWKLRLRNPKMIFHQSLLSFLIVIITGAVLVYGTLEMPDFGAPDAPANLHVASRYIEKSYEETGVENFVTAVLASYRGYDTLGEATVIFTAGICVILLLRRKKEE